MNLVSRTKNILLSPKQEWPVIDDEATSVGGLYIGYIVPLAAIGPVASSIRMALFGISVPSMGTYPVPIGAAVRQGIAQYVMRSEEHTSELQSHHDLVCRLLLEKKKHKV